jgi:hypothetical protein
VRFLRGLAFLVALVVGSLAGSQVPRFIQEYEQRLGGALQEAQRQQEDFRRIAEAHGLSFEEYVERLRRTPDVAVRQTAAVIERTARRLLWLDEQARALARAPRLLKPVALLRWRDSALLQATWERFVVGFTLDPAFGGIGALIAGGLVLGMGHLLRPPQSVIRLRRPPVTGPD